jgi:Fic family protein
MTEPKEIKPTKVKVLPPKINYQALMRELTEAHAAVGELRGLLRNLPNPDILIAPFRKREAVASSAIEGTRATIEEVLKYEAEGGPKEPTEEDRKDSKIEDIKEIRNYEVSMGVALDEMKTRPIGENLIKKTHSYLLNSVRGANKNRGSFRREQVRVGDYIPPVHNEISGLMTNWEKYLNTEMEGDPLIRIGVAHYQFEAIHPFMDGNGRIGRLIIPLYLCQESILQTPVLYISHYLEKNKVEYQNLLHKVDTDEDWVAWLKFFLVAVKVQAKMTATMATEIQNLYEEMKSKTIQNIKSQHSIAVLDAIFKQPILRAKDIQKAIKAKSKGTTYNLINKFVQENILKEIKSLKRDNIYVFSDLMKIIRQ